ncbi:MAG: 6,7-dimethyl-8-ribityllumazine synthase [Gammaproteobacteria bacterium]
MSDSVEKARPSRQRFDLYDARLCLVAARFNEDIVAQLIAGARRMLNEHGIADTAIKLVRVPGAFELPLAIKKLSAAGDYDGFIALGAVIRGGTPHFEYVSGECFSGISRVMYESEVPVGMGVLTVDTIEQAVERSGDNAENKGAEAALATLEMISLLRDLDH